MQKRVEKTRPETMTSDLRGVHELRMAGARVVGERRRWTGTWRPGGLSVGIGIGVGGQPEGANCRSGLGKRIVWEPDLQVRTGDGDERSR